MKAGELSIVDSTGTAVAVTAPAQVNLTSAALRIARPAPAPCAICGQPAHTGPCPTSSSAAGSATDGGSTTTGSTTPTITASGATSAGGSTTTPASPANPDKSVAFSFTANLLANADTADKFAALFRAFYLALDERQISYLQGTLNLVTDAATAEQLQPLLAELGLTATVKDI